MAILQLSEEQLRQKIHDILFGADSDFHKWEMLERWKAVNAEVYGRRILTTLIDEPNQQARPRIVLAGSDTPIASGQGNTNYFCGCCGKLLLENVSASELPDVVLQCKDCGAFSEPVAIH